MSQFRLARISLILAALGLNAVPTLLTSAHAQSKPATPAAPAAKQDSIRKEMYALLDPVKVKELMTAKNYTQVQANITAAEAFPELTPYEKYVIGRMKIALGSGSGNDKMAMEALETVINSGYLEKKDQGDFIQALGNFHYNAKDYTKAIEWFKRYQKEAETPEKITSSLIRAYYFNNDFASAKTELEKLVADTEKAGQVPSVDDLRMLASSAAKLKQMDSYGNTMEKLVRYHPTEEFWADMLRRMQSKPTYNEKLQLDVYRLQTAAMKEMTADEYIEFTELALLAGYFTEAKKAMDAGYANGVLGQGSNAAKHKQVRDKATKGAADDAKTIASGEPAALKARTGLPMVNLGYAYVTMDQFDKGLDLMQKGIAKGGLKNEKEVQLRLGAAYAKAGRKADAVKVFEGIKGTSDTIGDIARYWLMHLNAAPAAAAPAVAGAAPVAPAPAPAVAPEKTK